jgi:hypothetical protein
MKDWIIRIIIGVAIVAAVILVKRHNAEPVTPFESQNARLTRLRLEAPIEVNRQTTNVLIGYTRTIRTTIQDFDNNPTRWTAEVVAEHLNTVGGVERKSLRFKFEQFNSHLIASQIE